MRLTNVSKCLDCCSLYYWNYEQFW